MIAILDESEEDRDIRAEMRQERDERATDAARYPSFAVASPGLFYESRPFPVPTKPEPLELVFLRLPRGQTAETEYRVAAVEWNLLWESAHLRADLFQDWQKPNRRTPQWFLDHADRNIHFVTHIKNDPSTTFEPLYCMMPASTLRRAGLPVAGRALWPLAAGNFYDDMPADADARFERALSMHLWPRLLPRQTHRAFSEHDPIQVLTHSPTFWLPHALRVCYERASWFERIESEWSEQQRKHVDDVNAHPLNLEVGVRYEASRRGGTLWQGESEAAEATDDMVEYADAGGHLRSLIEAVLSNRAHDDFTSCWSHEKEDFERAMYHKRAKIKVSFVELPEQEAIHSAFTQLEPSPERDVVDRLMFNDFLTLLDAKNRSIVICMRRGLTTASEISRALGYANHSPVSKRLRQIRKAAQRFFLEDRSI